ncbi:MAG: hypothetical protein QOF37_1832 [Thermoleophilaceae bacterium]|nr:hypothetical protein [Thermoleophilaceae bacterium]
MSLTLGSGPFGHHPSGVFNGRFDGPKHLLYFEDFPRRVRALIGGETLIDTVNGRMLYESSLPPVLYVPIRDVRQDLIATTDHSTYCPFKGDATYWTAAAGDRVEENVLWGYREPIASAPWLSGYVAAYWDRMDAWYEEAEKVFGRLRDPYHRVDVVRSDALVTVRANGEVVAESTRSKLLFETSLPVRAYIPLEDVRRDLLAPSDKTTICPYKGTANYWSVRTGGGETLDDVVWAYEQPFPESAGIEGHVSFLGDGIDVEIDRDSAAKSALAA